MVATRHPDASGTPSKAAPAGHRAPAPAAAIAAGAAALVTVGCALLAIGHAGVRLPLVSVLGPGGDRAVPVAAAVFTAATVCYAVVTRGLLGRMRWAWPAGLVLSALTVVGAARPFRGVGSAVGIVLAAAIVAALVSTPGRRAFGR